NGLDRAGQVVSLAAEHHDVIGAVQVRRGRHLRLQHRIATRAFDAQALRAQLLGARLAHQESDIRAGLRRASAEIAAGAAGAEKQQSHLGLRSMILCAPAGRAIQSYANYAPARTPVRNKLPIISLAAPAVPAPAAPDSPRVACRSLVHDIPFFPASHR